MWTCSMHVFIQPTINSLDFRLPACMECLIQVHYIYCFTSFHFSCYSFNISVWFFTSIEWTWLSIYRWNLREKENTNYTSMLYKHVWHLLFILLTGICRWPWVLNFSVRTLHNVRFNCKIYWLFHKTVNANNLKKKVSQSGTFLTWQYMLYQKNS
jgi:hypothetical protein